MPHWAKYLKAGGTFCPFCKSVNIVGGSFEVTETIAESAFQEMCCECCGASWYDQYELVNAFVLDGDNKERRSAHVEKGDPDSAQTPSHTGRRKTQQR